MSKKDSFLTNLYRGGHVNFRKTAVVFNGYWTISDFQKAGIENFCDGGFASTGHRPVKSPPDLQVRLWITIFLVNDLLKYRPFGI